MITKCVLYSLHFLNKSDILKTKGKLKIMRDDIVEENVTHTMPT